MAIGPTPEVTYVGDDVTTDFAITFEYALESEVFVSVDGVDTPFEFFDAGTARVTPAPANASAIIVYRSTSVEKMRNVFEQGAPFVKRTVDENNTQILQAVQEIVLLSEQTAVIASGADTAAADAQAAVAVAEAAAVSAQNAANVAGDNALNAQIAAGDAANSAAAAEVSAQAAVDASRTFATLEEFRVSAFDGDTAIIVRADVGRPVINMVLYKSGTGTPTTAPDIYAHLVTGVFCNAGGVQYKLSTEIAPTPEYFGAYANDVNDDHAALQYTWSYSALRGAIRHTPGKTYRTTQPVIAVITSIAMTIHGDGAIIRADHNGDGLGIVAQNENYSRHSIYDLTVQGPNVAFPANPSQLAGTSTGAGLKAGRDDTVITSAAYLATFYNCNFQQFHKGIYLQNALLCKFFGGYVAFNQYGIYADAGATNANTFTGVGIRQNRKRGVYSSGRTGGSLTKATHNVFISCTLETNIPYDASAGGYPAAYDPVDGVGVELRDSYDWIFDDCYFENHNRSVVIDGSSDDNRFVRCRFDSNAVRPGYVVIAGTNCNGNVWEGCKMNDYVGHAAGTFHNLSATNVNNQLLDCTGFSLNPAYVLAYPYIRNLKKAQASSGSGQFYGAITMPPQGYISNPGEGTTQGKIQGIGTATATLHCFGCGEVQLGSLITSPTTITTLAGARPGSFLVITNYQNANAVTLKSALDGTGAIVLKGFVDAVFNNYGQMIVLYCTHVAGGRFYEVSRNF